MRNNSKSSKKMTKHVKSMPKSQSLTQAQLRALAKVKTDFNPHIRLAWYFALHTGLLFKEIEVLTLADLSKLRLNRQAKEIVSLLDVSHKQADCLVFDLPIYANCYNALRLWSALAGFDFVAGYHMAVKTYRVNRVKQTTKSHTKQL